MERQAIYMLIAFTVGLGLASVFHERWDADSELVAEDSMAEGPEAQVELERLEGENSRLRRELYELRERMSEDAAASSEVASSGQEEVERLRQEQQAEKKEAEKRVESGDRGGNIWSRLTSEERSEIRSAWRNQRMEGRLAALENRLGLDGVEREQVRGIYETDWDEIDVSRRSELEAVFQSVSGEERVRIDMLSLDEDDRMRLMAMRQAMPEEKYAGYLSYLEDRDIAARSSRATAMLGRVNAAVSLRPEQRTEVLEVFMNDEEGRSSWRRFHQMKSMDELDSYYDQRLGKLATVLDERQFAVYAEQTLIEKEAAAKMLEIMLSKREE